MAAVPGFAHQKGAHCESKSLQDVLNWAGFPVTEALTFGLDATLGFTYIDFSAGTRAMARDFAGEFPFFVGGKSGTLSAQSLACRVLGATIEERSFGSADKAWVAAQGYLNSGQPLAIMVDMYHLTFLSTFNNFHFGRHAVVLAGHDPARDKALIADVTFDALQEITVADLKLARGSTAGGKYMAPCNTHFTVAARPDGKHPPLAAGAKLAIQQVVKNMLAASVSYAGIQALDHFAASIPEWKTLLGTKAQATFEMLYGYIEDYGTGGAIFRQLYKNFLQELLVHPQVTGKDAPRAWPTEDQQVVKETILLLEDDILAWHAFSGTLKQAVKEAGKYCLTSIDLVDLESQVRGIARRERDIFSRLSKLKL